MNNLIKATVLMLLLSGAAKNSVAQNSTNKDKKSKKNKLELVGGECAGFAMGTGLGSDRIGTLYREEFFAAFKKGNFSLKTGLTYAFQYHDDLLQKTEYDPVQRTSQTVHHAALSAAAGFENKHVGVHALVRGGVAVDDVHNGGYGYLEGYKRRQFGQWWQFGARLDGILNLNSVDRIMVGGEIGVNLNSLSVRQDKKAEPYAGVRVAWYINRPKLLERMFHQRLREEYEMRK